MRTPDTVIKKYGNRRLYDTSHSRYVNLSEIAGMIRNGDDVRVVDARTGEDLTRSVLMQIISEDNKGGPSALPLEFLRQLVVASDHVGREFLMWYLKSAFDAYGKVQQSFTSGLSDLQAAASSPVRTIRNLFAAGPAADSNDEVEQLKKRLLILESQLEKNRSRKRGGRRKARKKQR